MADNDEKDDEIDIELALEDALDDMEKSATDAKESERNNTSFNQDDIIQDALNVVQDCNTNATAAQNDTNDDCGHIDLPGAVHVLDAHICECW